MKTTSYARAFGSLGVILGLMFGGPVNAALIKAYEFNVDGVLPSADADTNFGSNVNGLLGLGGFASIANPESEFFSVSGGLLRQRTLRPDIPVGFNAAYGVSTTVLGSSDAGADAALATVVEARLRVNAIATADPNQGQGFLQLFDGVFGYRLFIVPGGVRLASSSDAGLIAVDLGVFHDYRLESDGGSSTTRLFVDDVLKATVDAGPFAFNNFSFGDGASSGGGADIDWDYVRIHQFVIPEPGTLTLVVPAVAVLWGLRRGGRRCPGGAGTGPSRPTA